MVTPKIRDFIDKDIDKNDFNDIMYLVRSINTYGNYQYSINILTIDCEVHLPNNEVVIIEGEDIWSIIDTIYKAIEYVINHINTYHCNDAGLIAKELRLQYQLKNNEILWNDVYNNTHYNFIPIKEEDLLTDEILLLLYNRLIDRQSKVEYNYESIINHLRKRYYYCKT